MTVSCSIAGLRLVVRRKTPLPKSICNGTLIFMRLGIAIRRRCAAWDAGGPLSVASVLGKGLPSGSGEYTLIRSVHFLLKRSRTVNYQPTAVV